MITDSFTIRPLTAADADAFRTLRLEGLSLAPEAFTAAHEIECRQPLSFFEERISGSTVFGGFDTAGNLVGMMGLHVPASPRTGHQGEVWGVYVQPQARGTGLAHRLLAMVVDTARQRVGVEALTLGVGAHNIPALRTYERAGFRQIAFMPRLLKVEDRYIDEIIMRLAFDHEP